MTIRTPLPTRTETEAFREFLSRHMNGGLEDLSPEEVIRMFRIYESELERFVRETQESIDNGCKPREVDVNALKKRVAMWVVELSARAIAS